MLETYQNYRFWLNNEESKEFVKRGLANGIATPEVIEFINKYFPGMDYELWYTIAWHVCHDIKMPEIAPPGYEFVTSIVNNVNPSLAQPQNQDYDLTNPDDMSLYAIQYKSAE